jgi:hypothetical protein
MKSLLAHAALILLIALLVATPAHGTTLAMTLDGVEVQACDTAWTEGSCVLKIVETTGADFSAPGSCTFSAQTEGIELSGARLEIDVSALTGIDLVEVDLQEASGSAHTRIFAHAEGEDGYFNFVQSFWNGGSTDQTLMMDVTGYELGRIVISGHESLITEVRLEGHNLVGLPGTSWGLLKGRW